MGKLQPPQACVHDHGALQAHRACRKPYPSCEGDSGFKESSSTQSTRRSNAPHKPNAFGTCWGVQHRPRTTGKEHPMLKQQRIFDDKAPGCPLCTPTA